MDKQIKVDWAFSALEMLAEIHDYLVEQGGETVAGNYISGLIEYTDKLEKHPESCAPCRNNKLKEKGFRCCNFRTHVIIYEFFENRVQILAIIHSKRSPDKINI